jgi:crotonobetainyl-CoA:carnitine CoA-transferase CaiB-like acyl-CoA transferase
LKKGLAAYNEPTGIPFVDGTQSYPSNREEAKAHYRELKAELDAETAEEAKAQLAAEDEEAKK